MEWIDRLNKSMAYIEENLDGEIDYEAAAQIACYSVFHFQRMFAYIAGVPLSEYIRRRRMTAAAFDLNTGDSKVIDLAVKYGYDSPTAFNRAFKSVHGVAPSKARQMGISLIAYPPITFSLSIKGDAQMNYKIEQKEAIRIVGVKEHMRMNADECFLNVPVFWQKTVQSEAIPRILGLLNQPPFGLLGVSTCMNGSDLDYYIAAATDKPAPEDMSEYVIPAGTWAIFQCLGPMPQAIQNLQKRIVTEWLPTSGYEYANAPDIEVYSQGDQQSADYRSEVWLPIVKKQSSDTDIK